MIVVVLHVDCPLPGAKISGWELCDASFMGSFWVKVAVIDAFALQIDKLSLLC